MQAIADGQRVSANDYMLDGVSVNSLEWGGAAVITPNPEAVQEITVTSNTYSAQDGRNSGAQVKVISKSGTNSLHGSAFVKFNDKGLNAFNKFEGPTNFPPRFRPASAERRASLRFLRGNVRTEWIRDIVTTRAASAGPL